MYYNFATNVPEVKTSEVTEVPAGSTAVLNCHSNDYDHNFMFWVFGKDNIIGPINSVYDDTKYKYEVLSGKLHINNVSPEESGFYKCISSKLDQKSVSVNAIEMIVKGSFSASDGVKLAAIVISIIVLITCAVLYLKLKREWSRYDGRSIIPADDIDEEEGDEIYNQTTTAINQPMAGPSRNPSSEHLLYGIDNQGLDTDFNSVFENIQIKSPHPQPSLI